MKMSDVEKRQMMTTLDQVQDTLRFIGRVVVDESFSSEEKVNIIGVSVGVIDYDDSLEVED